MALDEFLNTTTLKPDKKRSGDIQIQCRDENGNLVGHKIQPSNAENQHEMLKLFERMTNYSNHVLGNSSNFRPFGTDHEKFLNLIDVDRVTRMNFFDLTTDRDLEVYNCTCSNKAKRDIKPDRRTKLMA